MRKLSARLVPRVLTPDNKRNRLYYAGLLGRFEAELKKKQPYLAKKKVLFLQDNTPVHTATTKLVELGYELLHHPLYSSDYTSWDLFLFPNLIKSLAGQKFESNEAVIAPTEAYIKCIELKEDYVEK
ncbi:unnamed protein product [Pieris macdunnoughi]|uniref:Mariner transposase n=1 Tax=Pieris macdunnoughi TaxID=345717 RepID=A0A821WZI5_9NEOP|nr:unnamed protein product [Pieris macdunnoughi]